MDFTSLQTVVQIALIAIPFLLLFLIHGIYDLQTGIRDRLNLVNAVVEEASRMREDISEKLDNMAGSLDEISGALGYDAQAYASEEVDGEWTGIKRALDLIGTKLEGLRPRGA